ncbi:LysM domain-containing protein [Chitinophaga skermanii]|uniref:LysM domain-containing protein n=1 Tax=Chitinophaga skermanii TaxID=331697 RepID=A0A327QF64_9BACT|nr:LysM peptidoglycan-binding domain-containing protein [Chitinophaga skermanii]RAJ00317.1 LysM domain-containing protein [Chitinophaga skermanii]
MFKPLMFVALFACFSTAATAQDSLVVQGSAADLHLVHTVKKGESLSSLGRAYGISPKEIATFNKITLDKGLNLGQNVNIPLNTTNFLQTAKTTAASGYKPVYHHVAEKETLYRISVNNRKVPIENIRTWNNFSGDGVKSDSYLIVGWLKVPGGAVPAAAKQAVQDTKQAAQEATKEVTTAATTTTDKAVEKTKTEVAKKEEAVKADATKAAEPVKKEVTTTVEKVNATALGENETFEQVYLTQTAKGKNAATEKGPGSWFRSNAVANSGKYYALHNSAPRGTIIKVTNPLNGKFIYAKVLDVIPSLKPNANLIVKLSDGAMSALGTNETRFYCELSYEDQN